MNLIKWIKSNLDLAIKEKSKLTKDVLSISGMSSMKIRHLLNNLCSFDGANYLEVGSWKGSTIISAAYGNKGNFFAIDNFSKRYKQKESAAVEFYQNKEKFKDVAPFEFFECDSFQFDKENIKQKIDIYFYDGNHSVEATSKALSYFNELLADTFIILMDDWNRGHIRTATKQAIQNYNILFEKELFTPGRKPDPHGDGFGSTKNRKLQTWWNGLYIAVLKK